MSGPEILSVLNCIVGPQGLVTESSERRRYDQDWRVLFNGRALCVGQRGLGHEAVVLLCNPGKVFPGAPA